MASVEPLTDSGLGNKARLRGQHRTVADPGIVLDRDRYEVFMDAVAFAQAELAPLASKVDKEERFPHESFEALRRSGWLGVPIARKYGGKGYGIHEDPLLWALIVEAFSAACGNTGLCFQIHGHCVSMVEELAEPEQVVRWSKEALEGAVWCSAGSDPGYFSQSRGARPRGTTVKKTDGGYIVNGRKIFITNAGAAELFLVFGQLEEDDGSLGGWVHPVVRRGTPGLTVLDDWKAMGMRGSASNTVVFDSVFVRDEDMIGADEPNKYFRSSFGGSFLGARAAVYLGMANTAIKFTRSYLGEKPDLAEDPVIHFRLGELISLFEVCRGAVHRALTTWEDVKRGEFDEQESSSITTLTNAFVGRAATQIATGCLEICGGRGMLTNVPLERILRDIRGYTLSSPSYNLSMVEVGAQGLQPEQPRRSIVGEGI